MSTSIIGEKLGSFRVESILGTGAMGVVYRAVHDPSGRPAAVKVISAEVAQRGKTYERFRREAEILQQFRHANIVRFYAVGRYQGTSYIAMEFVRGQTLEQLLAERGPLPWREVVDLGIQICDALHYAHEHGVVHRDLKPSNLMVSDSGEVKLTDFGIAKDLDATALTGTGRTLGTAAYMAPEQIRGHPDVSHKTDLYALGVVLFQMLAGKAPFEGPSAVVLMHSHLNDAAPRPSQKVAEIPKALDELIVKLMAKDPQDRPWDATTVGMQLTELRDKANRDEPVPMVFSPPGAGASATAAPKKPKKGTKARTRTVDTPRDRTLLTTVLLVVALIGIGGIIGWGLWPPGQDYLYKEAKKLMASGDRHDWMTAMSDYVDPLDKRFPDNPFKSETREWRDRLLLAEAEGRAKTLSSGVKTLLSEPKGKGELQFVAHHKMARDSSEKGDDLAAIQQWDDMAKQLDENSPDERPWVLYARRQVAILQKEIHDRREVVISQIQRLNAALESGKNEEAARLRDEILKNFGKYTDLADLLGTGPANAQPSSAPAHPANSSESPAPKS
jgi:serine/threonine-protein kinase